ncbi:MAG: hypothetical protein ACMUJM_22990 [bacterium]
MVGASNLTLSLPVTLQLIMDYIKGPKSIFVAHGPGRSYLKRAGLPMFRFQGISICPLFDELENVTKDINQPKIYALVTDIGDDLLYSQRPQNIANGVEKVLNRLYNIIYLLIFNNFMKQIFDMKNVCKNNMTRTMPILTILILLSTLPAPTLANPNWPGLPPDCWKESRIVHKIDSWQKLKENFKIERIKLDKAVKFTNISPNKGYSFKKEGFRPEVTISIYAEKDHLIVITISDVHGVSDINWINEKLLFIRIWWGRIAIDDVIFDVENELIVYTEPAVDGYLAYQQAEESCKRLGGCKCIKREDPLLK